MNKSFLLIGIVLFFNLSGCLNNPKSDNTEYHLTYILNKADEGLSEAQKELLLSLEIHDELAFPDDQSMLIHANSWKKTLLMEGSWITKFLKPKKSVKSLERKLEQIEMSSSFKKPSSSFAMDSMMAYLEGLGETPIIVGLPNDPTSIKDTLVKIGEKFEVYWAKSKEDLVRYVNTKVPKDAGSFELVVLQGISPEMIGGKADSVDASLPENTPAVIQGAYAGHTALMEKVREIKVKLEQLKVKPQTVAVKSEVKGLLKMLSELLQDDEELLSLIKAHPEAKSVEGLVKVLATELKKERQESRRLAEELKAAKEMIKQLGGIVEVQKGVIKKQDEMIQDAHSKLSYLQAQLECAFTFKKDIVSKAKEHDYPANGKGISRIAVLCKINENKHVTEGVRNVYLQLISPSGMPEFVRGSIYQNGETLSYSATAQAMIQKSGSEVKLVLENPNKLRLEEGLWKVKVFDENRKIGETQFEVK